MLSNLYNNDFSTTTMRYILDTNIIIYASQSKRFVAELNRDYSIFNSSEPLIISTVTLGELDSFTKQRNYGDKRRKLIQQLTDDITVVPINIKDVIKMYGTIDAFS